MFIIILTNLFIRRLLCTKIRVLNVKLKNALITPTVDIVHLTASKLAVVVMENNALVVKIIAKNKN